MKKTILLVEYDSPVIESVSDLFSGEGLEFTKVEDGEAAKKILEKQRFDLVITAAMLPKFHGFYLSQHIKESFPQTAVIIISGVFKGYEYRQQALTQYLADDYFEKPLDLVKLKSRAFELMKIHDDSALFDPSVTQIPRAKTNKIPTLKALEQEQNKLTSDDIFGDILKTIEKSSPAVKIDLDAPKAKPSSPPPSPEPKVPVIDRDELLRELVPVEQPVTVSPSVLLKKPVNVDSLRPGETVSVKPKEYKKLEDDISKKFEETLSGLGLSTRPSTPKPPPAPPAAKPQDLPPITSVFAPMVEKKAETGEEVGGYEILGPIARGGMAEIYKAKKKGVKGFEKIIALKKILSGYGEDQKYIEMFVDEAKIAAQLTHPNIVQIYDLGRKDDYYFIAMEYIEGKDLRLLLRQLAENEKYLPVELSVYMIIKVLEALYYAHTAKDSRGQTLDIVHRDVSPPNILIGYNGEIKLTDFGVSKASIKMHQTISGALKGKLLYMSPEQAKGDRNIDCRSDIFSAGVIFFEVLTNKKLFLDESEIQVLKKVQDGDIILPSTLRKDIDPELEAILVKSLQKDPKTRYQNAQEMSEALSAYLQKHYTQTPSPAHVAHYLMTLFAEEIRKNNIKVDLKKEPYQIQRRPQIAPPEKAPELVKPARIEPEKKMVPPPPPAKPVPPPPVQTTKPATLPPPAAPITVLSPTATQKIPLTPVKSTEPDPSIRSDEEFVAMEDQPIEIDLSGGHSEPKPPQLIKQTPPPPPPVKPAPAAKPAAPTVKSEAKAAPATSYHEELALLDQESNSKKKVMLLAAAAVVVAVILFFVFSGGDKQPTLPTVEGASEPALTELAQEQPTNDPLTGETTQSDLAQDPASQATATTSQTSQETLTATAQPQTVQAQQTVKPVPAASQPAPVNTQERQIPSKPIQPVVSTQTPEKKPEPAKPIQTPAPAPQEKNLATQTPVVKTEPEVKEEPQPEPVQPAPQPVVEAPKPEPVKQITEGMELPINELDVQPQKVNAPAPEFSKKALKSVPPNTTLLAKILVNHKGNVERVVMTKKTNVYDVDMTVYGTLGKWTFRPGLKNNIAVKVWITIPITLN
jgi:serine/threonine protein kinase/DNA-binding response OmpR family regulator